MPNSYVRAWIREVNAIEAEKELQMKEAQAKAKAQANQQSRTRPGGRPTG